MRDSRNAPLDIGVSPKLQTRSIASWTTRCTTFAEKAARLKYSPRSRSLGIGIQTSARHAPCGFNSKPFTFGTSTLRTHKVLWALESDSTRLSVTARSSYRTVVEDVF